MVTCPFSETIAFILSGYEFLLNLSMRRVEGPSDAPAPFDQVRGSQDRHEATR
jgi:hypothetical protein